MSGFSGDYYELTFSLNGYPISGYKRKLVRVTTVLNALPKFLQWWGFKLGIEATIDHIERLDGDQLLMDTEYLYDLFKEEKRITPNSRRDDASQRGLDIHDIAEAFFKEGRIPRPDEVPVEQHGYVKALARWWNDQKDQNIILAESPVFSLEHDYAGTLDILTLSKCVDFKTGKSIYDSALVQVGAYRHAVIEMGLATPSIRAAVVQLKPNGEYVERFSDCTIEDFQKVRAVWELLERLKGGADGVVASNPIGSRNSGGKLAPRPDGSGVQQLVREPQEKPALSG